MNTNSLLETLKNAEEKNIAIGHFNTSTLEVVWAIYQAAKKLDLPIVIGVSEGERDFVGINAITAIVRSIKEETHYPIFLNADHTYSLERVKEVVAAGFDSVIYDGAKLPLEENIKNTKEVVDYVKSVRPEMLVEAEIGYIGSSSKMLDEIPAEATITADAMPSVGEVKRFVSETGTDLISPAVGNIHGMLKTAQNPNLNIELIRNINQAVDTPMVLHGGSGISDQDFKAAIEAGISMVHINTEIRLAWRQALQETLEKDAAEVAPYKILKEAQQAVEDTVEKRLRLFARL